MIFAYYQWVTICSVCHFTLISTLKPQTGICKKKKSRDSGRNILRNISVLQQGWLGFFLFCVLYFVYSKEMPQHVAYFSLDLSGPIKLLLDGLLSSWGQHFQMQVPPIKHLNKRSGSVSAEHLQLLLRLMNIFTANTLLSRKTGFNASGCLQLGTKNWKCCSVLVLYTRVAWKIPLLTWRITFPKREPRCWAGSAGVGSLWTPCSLIHRPRD